MGGNITTIPGPSVAHQVNGVQYSTVYTHEHKKLNCMDTLCKCIHQSVYTFSFAALLMSERTSQASSLAYLSVGCHFVCWVYGSERVTCRTSFFSFMHIIWFRLWKVSHNTWATEWCNANGASLNGIIYAEARERSNKRFLHQFDLVITDHSIFNFISELFQSSGKFDLNFTQMKIHFFSKSIPISFHFIYNAQTDTDHVNCAPFIVWICETIKLNCFRN